jgi:hypothetical protein
MKKVMLVSAIFFGLKVFPQTSNHSFYIGSNLSGINLDLSSSGISGLNLKDFSNAKIGFNLGYKYLLSLSDKLTFGAGLDFKNINCSFDRPHYNDPNDINPNLTSVNESLKFYRFSIPIQGYYNIISKEHYSFYISLGADLNLTNNANRTADYKTPSPPTGYVDGRFKGTQKIKFNEKTLGVGILAGIGNEIIINKITYFIELSYYSDISKSKILTLHNIESDNFFYGKLKWFQLKIGHIFSLKPTSRK